MSAERVMYRYDHFLDPESPPQEPSDERDHIDKDLMKGWDHEIDEEDLSPWSGREPEITNKPKSRGGGRHKRGHSLKSNRDQDKNYNSAPGHEFNISLNRVFSSKTRQESEDHKLYPESTYASTNARYSEPLNDLFEKGVMSARRDSRDSVLPNSSLRKSKTYRDISSETTMTSKHKAKRPSTSIPKNKENYVQSVISFPPKLYSSNKETFEEKKARITNLVSDGPVKGERISIIHHPTPPKFRKPMNDKLSMVEMYMKQKMYQDESLAHPQYALADPLDSFSLTQTSKMIPRLYQSAQKKFFYDSRHEISSGNISVDKFGRTRKVVINPKLVLEPNDLSPSKHFMSASMNKNPKASISKTGIKDRSITVDGNIQTHEEKSLLDSAKKKPQEESTHAFGFVTKLLSTLKTKPESMTNINSHRTLTSAKGERSPISAFNRNVIHSLNKQGANKRPTTSTNPIDRSKSPVISSYRARKIKETGIGLQAALLQGRHAKIIRFE